MTDRIACPWCKSLGGDELVVVEKLWPDGHYRITLDVDMTRVIPPGSPAGVLRPLRAETARTPEATAGLVCQSCGWDYSNGEPS